MERTASIDSPKPFDAATMSADVAAILRSKDEQIALQAEQIEALRHQVKWFERQIFGQKSERFVAESNPQQLYLGQLPIPDTQPQKRKLVPAHTRGVAKKDGADSGESLKFFDESRVPIRSIHLEHPDTADKSPEQYEIIGEKITYRLIQNPGSYEILKVHRPVVKIKDSEQILCAPAPAGVIEDSRADVSFIAGVLVDKFAWHPAAVSSASAPAGRRHYRQPSLADPDQPEGYRPAGPDLRRSVRLGAEQPGQGHGRDPDPRRTLRARQDEYRLLLADLR